MTLNEFLATCAYVALIVFCVIGSFWFANHGAW
jgi:uncharacterized membrane protein